MRAAAAVWRQWFDCAAPAVMIVSNAQQGLDDWIVDLSKAVLREPLLVQIREKQWERLRIQHLLSRALARVQPFGSRLVVNSDCGAFPQATGVHLTGAALMAAKARPDSPLVGASCHDERELDHAGEIGVDYVVVGPVKKTPSHPQAIPLGWDRFAALVRDRPAPAYAIGGLARADLPEARRRGAHGVALRSAAFESLPGE